MSKIRSIEAKEIKDSRGEPAIEVTLTTEKGSATASVPSRKSMGKNEAVTLHASKAIENVKKIIAPKLKGKNPENQKELDALMIQLDGTENKSKLGANAILAVSVAVCRAGAVSEKLPLYCYIAKLAGMRDPLTIPLPIFNILEGRAHAKNELVLQEFMVVPQRKSFGENFSAANKVFDNLKKVLAHNFGDQEMMMGDEGGFAPNIHKTEQALFLLKNAIGNEDAKIIIDAAASQFYQNGKYILEEKEFSRLELLHFYKDLIARFHIIAIEDPFTEEDWEGFREITKTLTDITIVGDDLTTTNIKNIKEAHGKNACNGVVIKPGQAGTVTETIESALLAKSFGWKTIVGHESGETMDTFIADLAVGIGADFIKAGSPSQPERMAKYQRLLEIENEAKK